VPTPKKTPKQFIRNLLCRSAGSFRAGPEHVLSWWRRGELKTRSQEIPVRKGRFYEGFYGSRIPVDTGFYRLSSPRDGRSRSSQLCEIPRLLSDNGPSYLSAQLGAWLDEHGRDPQSRPALSSDGQGKIERYYRSLKNRILIEHYYLPGSWKLAWPSSSTSTTPGAITRAWVTSPRSISTSAADQPFSRGGKPSKTKPSNYGVGFTNRPSTEP
jgi:hypothetical protein